MRSIIEFTFLDGRAPSTLISHAVR